MSDVVPAARIGEEQLVYGDSILFLMLKAVITAMCRMISRSSAPIAFAG
jgi:hypothetical protein